MTPVGDGVRSRPGHPLLVQLVPDDPRTNERVLRWACTEAAQRNLAMQLVCAYVPPAPVSAAAPYAPGIPVAGINATPDTAHAVAHSAEELVRTSHPRIDVHSHAVEGVPCEVLPRLAAQADSLVIGTGWLSSKRLGFPISLQRTMVARAPVPVVLVRDTLPSAAAPIVVCIRSDEPAGDLLAYGFEEARRHRVNLRALLQWHRWPRHAGTEDNAHDAEAWLFDTLAWWRREFPDVSASGAATTTRPEHLRSEATQAQLLVVSRRRNRVPRRRRVARLTRAVLPVGSQPVAIIPASITRGV